MRMGIWGGGEDDLSILLFVMDRDFRAIRPARHAGHAAQKTPSLQQAGFLMACAEKKQISAEELDRDQDYAGSSSIGNFNRRHRANATYFTALMQNTDGWIANRTGLYEISIGCRRIVIHLLELYTSCDAKSRTVSSVADPGLSVRHTPGSLPTAASIAVLRYPTHSGPSGSERISH